MVGRAEEEVKMAVVGTLVEVVEGRRDWVSGALLWAPLPPSIILLRVGLLGWRGAVTDPSLRPLPIFFPLLGSLSLHCGTC